MPIVDLINKVYCLTSCSNSDNKPVMIDKRISPPEPDKHLREKYQAQRTAKSSTCLFDNPESATSVLKVKRLDGDTIYYFNSQYQKQILGVTIHPGDVYSQVS